MNAVVKLPSTTPRTATRSLVDKIHEISPTTSWAPSKLGVFNLEIDTVEVCDFFLNMNIDAPAEGKYDQSKISNRSKKQIGQARLMSAMSDGRWDPHNGETIKVARGEDGSMMLIDGQHRLEAVRAHLKGGGAPITVTIMTGMDPSCVLTVDTGTPRTVADFLTMCSGGSKSENMYSNDVSSAGRNAFRAFYNPNSHPFKKPDGIAFTDGDIAGWLMDSGVAGQLRDVRHNFSSSLGKIANPKIDGNAGAKPWLTYLMWEWSQIDKKLAIDILSYLSSNQDVELPKWDNGSPMRHWKFARQFAVECWREGQGFRGANKITHDKTMIAYAVAWNLSRGDRRHKHVRGYKSFVSACDSYWDTGVRDDLGRMIRKKVPEWPGIL